MGVQNSFNRTDPNIVKTRLISIVSKPIKVVVEFVVIVVVVLVKIILIQEQYMPTKL